MTDPISCPCSHRLACHDDGGCKGTDSSGCPCRLDSAEALYKAIDTEPAKEKKP